MLKHGHFLAWVLLLGLTLAAGCDRSQEKKGTAESGTPTPAAAVPVRLGYFANLTHAQAVLGVSTGEFEKAVAPGSFETKVFNAGPSLIEALLANQIDIGYVGPSPVLSAQAKTKGQGIRVVSGAAINGVLIVAGKDSGIKTLADLKDKKIATPQLGNTQDVSAKHYLLKQLAQADTANVLPVANAEQSALMARGQIDAAWAPEPWGSRLIAEAGAVLIAQEKDVWPDKQFTLTLIVTTPEFLKAHPEAVEKILRVHRTWTAKLQAEPAKYANQLDEAIAKLTNKKLPAGVTASALTYTQFSDEPTEASLRAFGDWAYDLGLAQQQVKLDGLVDTTILRRLQAEQPKP